MNDDMNEGPTSVDEYLAQGGAITRERLEHVIRHDVDGETFELVRDDETYAPYRCRISGVYAYQPPQGTLRMHRCHESRCDGWGEVQRDGQFYCEEHGRET